MKKYIPTIALALLASAFSVSASAQVLFNTSFEPGQGYSSTLDAPLPGQPSSPPQWTSTWAGGQLVIAHAWAIGGGQSARAYGTSTGAIQFNTDSQYTNVILDGYIRPDFSSSGTSGSAQFFLMANATGTIDVGLRMNEDGTFVARTASTNTTADSITIVDDTYYHVAIEANYETGEAKFYLGTTTVGVPTTLTEANLVSFGGDPIINFGTDKGFAEYLGLVAGAGAEVWFDNISVSTVPESSTVALSLGAVVLGLAFCLRRQRRA